MSVEHALMSSRYELKYLIPARLSERVRDFVRQHLALDPFAGGPPHYSYPVHSLYFDSDDWSIFQRTVNGDRNRYKLRVRYYNESERTPVFWEIKRRCKDVILKKRCGVPRRMTWQILQGQLPTAAETSGPDHESDMDAIQEFFRLQFADGAKGRLHVAYDREAYVSPTDDEFRVTFDRHVRVLPRFGEELVTRMDQPFVCTGTGDHPLDVVILELKFRARFPDWYRDLVESFNLMQGGAAKYVDGTFLYGGRRMAAADVIRSLVL